MLAWIAYRLTYVSCIGSRTGCCRYGDWESLGASIRTRCDASEYVLSIGCGNSELSGQMWDDGFQNQVG